MNTVIRSTRLVVALALTACARQTDGPPAQTRATVAPTTPEAAAFWNSATVYFLLTDRFQNGDSANDRALGRAHDGALLRNFEGGSDPHRIA